VKPFYIDTPLVQIESMKKNRAYIIYVPEPRYLERYHGNLTELVTKIVHKYPKINIHWFVKGSDETDEKTNINEASRWLKTSFLPKLSDSLKDLLKRDLETGRLGEIFEVEDIQVKTRHRVGPDHIQQRKDWVFVTVSVEITVTLNTLRPVPKYEASWLSEKLIVIGDVRSPVLLRNIVEQIHREEGKDFEMFHYTVIPGHDITFIFEDEQESYERLIYWAFYIDYENQPIDTKILAQLFQSVKGDLSRKPSDGVSNLLVLLSMFPPSYVNILSGTLDPKREKEIGVNRLYQERGEDLNFVLETLNELEKVLKKMGL